MSDIKRIVQSVAVSLVEAVEEKNLEKFNDMVVLLDDVRRDIEKQQDKLKTLAGYIDYLSRGQLSINDIIESADISRATLNGWFKAGKHKRIEVVVKGVLSENRIQ